MTPERQKQVLAVLAVILLIAVGRSFMKLRSPGGSGSGGRPAVSRMQLRPGAAKAGPEVVELRLADLEQKPGEFQPGRDPFRFQPKARPKPPPAPPPVRQPPPKPKKRPQQAARPAGPRPPEPAFVFLGSFGPVERRVAVFSDNVEIFNVVEGDVFKEAFVVRKIGYESADIGWVNFPQEPVRRLAAGG